jgi:lipoprotein-anchoring transpeptidase ErfK/SrfK
LWDSVISWQLLAASKGTRVVHRRARVDQDVARSVVAQVRAATHSRMGMATLGTVAAGAAAAGVVLALSPGNVPAPQAKAAGPLPSPDMSTPAPGVTMLATLRKPSARYASPGGRAKGQVPVQWYGRPSVLPVIGTRPGWVQVRLAQRPDGSTAWLHASDVTLSSTPYQIVINLATTHLSLYYHGQLVFSAPAGVGAVDDPTPVGQYFVAFKEPPPSPNSGYGAFILVTSDHSQTINNWEGSGDALIGIHGPLGGAQLIGSTGARISHGCIRLHEPALLRLSNIPAGTPVTVINQTPTPSSSFNTRGPVA